MSEAQFDVNIFFEITRNDRLHKLYLKLCFEFLHTVEQMIDLPLPPYKGVMFQKLTATIFQEIALKLYSMSANRKFNKDIYIIDKVCCQMLNLAAKFGYVSDTLYIAKYYYTTLRYKEALF